jgi:predicted nucleic acid-binding protein
MYLLDTNVISEPTRKKPSPKVLTWFKETPPESTYLSVLTIGEIAQGIAGLRVKGETGRADRTLEWLEDELLGVFAGRILGLDQDLLRLWGQVTGTAAAKGRPTPVLDSLLGVTALHNGMTLVTRNTADIEGLGVSVLNPWD